MSEELSQFDVSQKTNSARQDILVSLKDMVSLGVAGFSQSLAALFPVSNGSKRQITKELARWERRLQRGRKVS